MSNIGHGQGVCCVIEEGRGYGIKAVVLIAEVLGVKARNFIRRKVFWVFENSFTTKYPLWINGTCVLIIKDKCSKGDVS